MNKLILVVEDDPDVREHVKKWLLDNRYNAQTASTGSEAIEMVEKMEPDLMVLDLNLPDISGESVCREVKGIYPNLPVIMLTAKDSTNNLVHGFEVGADDYITKPFDIDELLVRIQARLKGQSNEQKMTIADLELNRENFEVTRKGKLLNLTQKEFELLEYLMQNKNRVLSREMIQNRVWAYDPDIESRVVDVYVGYLRKKIDSGHSHKLIHTIRGFGYVIKEK